jgi:hypothetical protein
MSRQQARRKIIQFLHDFTEHSHLARKRIVVIDLLPEDMGGMI